MTVDAFGLSRAAAPLVYTDFAYGESDRQALRLDSDVLFEFNIDTDQQGRLPLVGIGANSKMRSRIALLGDSEILRNDYGLLDEGNIGNTILMQRLIAWLLETPQDLWPPLPDGYTWIEIDGNLSDWNPQLEPTEDSVFDVNQSTANIERASAVHNRDYLYIQIETTDPISNDSHLLVDFNVNGARVGVDLSEAEVVVESFTQTTVLDAAMAIDNVIEARIPLRITGETPNIIQLCVSVEDAPISDCLDAPLVSTFLDEPDPVPVRWTPGPEVTVLPGDGANLRTAPGTDSDFLRLLQAGDVLPAIGRDETGNWIAVVTARQMGWVSSLSIIANTDLQILPVLEG